MAAGKVTAVSVFRFAKVTTSGPGGQLSVEVRGAPSEKVELLFAKRPSGRGSKFVCAAKTVTIGPGGTAVVDSA